MEIDENEAKRYGKVALISSAVSLFFAVFMHALVLLLAEAAVVAVAYVMCVKRKRDKEGTCENENPEEGDPRKESKDE